MRIPVCAPAVAPRQEEYVLQALRDNAVAGGPHLARFEEGFARWVGRTHGVACCNGSAALEIALAALHLPAGSEVIIPDFTLIAVAVSVIRAGLRPVLVDVEPDTRCLDPQRVAAAVTPRTAALLVAHTYGHPADMGALSALAARHRLLLIEDAAEAHGAQWQGRNAGTFGTLACFSFYANKLISTGEGGMVLTDDAALRDRLRLLRNAGFTLPRFRHDVFATNYRLTNLQAALGCAQLEMADAWLQQRIGHAQHYTRRFSGCDAIIPPVTRPDCRNSFWMYGIELSDACPVDRDTLMQQLEAQGIETRPFFVPLHRQPVFAGDNPLYPDTAGDFPVSDRLAQRGLYLPSGTALTAAQLDTVADAVLAAVRA